MEYWKCIDYRYKSTFLSYLIWRMCTDLFQTSVKLIKKKRIFYVFFNDGELEMVSFSYSSRFLAMFCGLLSLLRMRNVQLNLGLISLQWGRYIV